MRAREEDLARATAVARAESAAHQATSVQVGTILDPRWTDARVQSLDTLRQPHTRPHVLRLAPSLGGCVNAVT